MTTIPTLETTHLTLRPLRAEDASVLHQLYQDEGVLRYFPRTTPPPLENVLRFITNQAAHWEENGCGNLAIQLRGGNGEMMGWAGVELIPDTGETEVGYLLGRPYWGGGYATQAALAVLRDGFNRLPVEQVIGLTHPENIASQRVLEKCGLRYWDRKTYFGMEMCRYRVERANFQRLAG